MVQALTVVLVQLPSGYLMINRVKAPFQGMWNALGGKVEPGETPLVGAVRELHEESGLDLPTLTTCGLVHWRVDGRLRGNLYLFTGTSAKALALPRATREGILATFPEEWLLAPSNLGIVPDLVDFLPKMIAGRSFEGTTNFTGDQYDGLTVANHD